MINSLQQDADSKSPTVHAGHNMPAGKQTHNEMVKADMNNAAQSFQRYACPMHPQIVQDEPGKYPLCGRTLVPLTKSNDGSSHNAHTSGIADFKNRFHVGTILPLQKPPLISTSYDYRQ